MGVPIMVAVTVVETLVPGRPRGLAIPVVAAALAGGARAAHGELASAAVPAG